MIRILDTKPSLLFCPLVAIVGLLHLFFLAKSPPVLVDEPWLAERSLALLHTGKADLASFPLTFGKMSSITPLRDWIQSKLIHFFGFNLFGIRLISLLAFLGSLPLWYHYFSCLFGARCALTFICFYSFQLNVWISSHFARPEAGLLFFMALSLCLGKVKLLGRNLAFFLMGLSGGLAFYFYPVGILIPITVGSVYLIEALQKRSFQIMPFGIFLASVIGTLFSYFLFVDYNAFRLSIVGPTTRLVSQNFFSTQSFGFLAYFLDEHVDTVKRLRILVLSAVLITIFLGGRVRRSSNDGFESFCAALTGLAATFLFLLFFAPTSHFYFVYLYAWLTILLVTSVYSLTAKRPFRVLVYSALIFTCLANWIAFLGFFRGHDFQSYQRRITDVIPAGSTVLARIPNRLVFSEDYRFLAFEDLDTAKRLGLITDLSAYVEKFGINYVLYDSALEKGEAEAPTPFHFDDFLRQHAKAVGEIFDNFYGSRDYDRVPWRGMYPYWRESFLGKRNRYFTRIYKIERS